MGVLQDQMARPTRVAKGPKGWKWMQACMKMPMEALSSHALEVGMHKGTITFTPPGRTTCQAQEGRAIGCATDAWTQTDINRACQSTTDSHD